MWFTVENAVLLQIFVNFAYHLLIMSMLWNNNNGSAVKAISALDSENMKYLLRSCLVGCRVWKVQSFTRQVAYKWLKNNVQKLKLNLSSEFKWIEAAVLTS